MNEKKAIKIALECMEAMRKKKHSDNLAGFSPKASAKEAEIAEAVEVLKKVVPLPDGHSGSSLECMHPFCVAERKEMQKSNA